VPTRRSLPLQSTIRINLPPSHHKQLALQPLLLLHQLRLPLPSIQSIINIRILPSLHVRGCKNCDRTFRCCTTPEFRALPAVMSHYLASITRQTSSALPALPLEVEAAHSLLRSMLHHLTHCYHAPQTQPCNVSMLTDAHS
jgi:hypothetical protein